MFVTCGVALHMVETRRWGFKSLCPHSNIRDAPTMAHSRGHACDGYPASGRGRGTPGYGCVRGCVAQLEMLRGNGRERNRRASAGAYV